MDLDEHPWVDAAKNMPMQPIMAATAIRPVTVTQDGKPTDSAILSVAHGAGVTTVFLNEAAILKIMEQGKAILDYWNEKKGSLIVPDSQTVRDINRSRIK